ncbi:MAG: isochorismate synthase, partial [Actinobacteria bacterium]|nr:isochorismate synthase [Actinomycetota bacterium]
LNVYPVKGYSITVNLNDEQSQHGAPTVSLLDDETKLVTSRLGLERFRVAGTAEFNGENRDIRMDRIKPLVSWVEQCFPKVNTRSVVPWAGLRPMMPNMLPHVGKGKKRGVFYNTGHGHLGWTLSCYTAEAIGDIRSGELDKVVLARVFTRGPIDTPAVLRALAERFPTCATFAFGVGNRAFIGASPERLVTLDGREVSTVALAGTTGTGGDETADAELAAEMLASPKIRAEHQFVVDDITARLATLGLVGETPVEPDVMRLARVQHLRTPITARVERRSGGVSDMDVIRVANVLHPSPAVGGTPSDPAVEWILANERFDRGWYAAPVGWTDLDGNGELRVALRSALVDESQVQLFSGAGIVADSDPDDELAETGVKLRALLDVMESAR